MKDLLKISVLGAVLFLIFVLVAGCGVVYYKGTYSQKVPETKPEKDDPYVPPKRCKILGWKKGKHTVVFIQKDCLKLGMTTIVITTLHRRHLKRTFLEARKSVELLLGFFPNTVWIGTTPGKLGDNHFFIVGE